MTQPNPGGAAGAVLRDEHRELLQKFRDRKRIALARAISIVENQRPGFQSLLHDLHPEIGDARLVGVTGPPGAGKSTITASLIERFRARGETVGVVAIDPTSPYTGGALLGDRIRMSDVAQDDGVFIRSMATRGALGGLAAATREVVDVMAAYGFDVVLVETVGVGQSELDIAAAADSTVVVLVPESGDSIQTMKAGLMEAADLFVVNKADRPGAPRLAKEVEMMLHLRLGDGTRNAPAHHGVRLRPRSPEARSGAGPSSSAPDDGPPASREAGEASKSKERGAEEEGSKSGGAGDAAWQIPVLLTTAATGEGLEDLVTRLDEHAAWLRSSGELERRRRARLEERVRDAVQQALLVRAWQHGDGRAILESSLDALLAGETTPYEVAARIVAAAVAGSPARP